MQMQLSIVQRCGSLFVVLIFFQAPASNEGQSDPSTSGQGKAYWLMKSEPSEFSWEMLSNAKDQTTNWNGAEMKQCYTD